MIEKIRLATKDDAKLLFRWVNDPDVRQSAFEQKPILWESHERWFTKRLNDPDCHIFIGMDVHDEPVAQARFEFICFPSGIDVTIDISIDKNHRRNGHGVELLKMCMEELTKQGESVIFNAFIRPENDVSIKMFEKAGFSHGQYDDNTRIKSLHMVKRIN